MILYPTRLFTFDSFLAVYEELADRHLGIRKPDPAQMRLVRKYTLGIIGDLRMEEIYTDHINLVLRSALQMGLSLRRVGRLRGLLVRIFELALIYGLVWKNYARDADRYTEELPSPVWYTDDQIRNIMQAITEVQYSHIYATMMMTGIVADRSTALTWDCVDFGRDRIDVIQRIEQQGGTMRLICLDETERYSVHMPAELRDMLKRERKIQESCRALRSRTWSNPDRLVFTDTCGGAVPVRALQPGYARVQKMSGIQDFCMRTIRSNYIVASLREGREFPTVIRQSGLVNVDAIMRYYYEAAETLECGRADMFRDYMKGIRR